MLFKVTAPVNADIDDMKKLVHEECKRGHIYREGLLSRLPGEGASLMFRLQHRVAMLRLCVSSGRAQRSGSSSGVIHLSSASCT